MNFSIGFSLILILGGCSINESQDIELNNEVFSPVDSLEQATEVPDDKIPPLLELLGEVQRASVITPGGSEINLDLDSWFNEVKDNLNTIYPSTSSKGQYDYTVVLWSKKGSPYIVQINSEGINIGDQLYTSTNIEGIMKYLRDVVGRSYLKNLYIDHLTIFAEDALVDTINLPDETMEAMIKEIEEMGYVEEPPMFGDPLYPHYVLQLMIGGKSVIHLDVIGDQLLSLSYGKNEKLYYKTTVDLYQELFQLFPPLAYSEDTPKSLFSASSIEINLIDREQSIQFGGALVESRAVEAIIHSFVRMLSDGNMTEQQESQDLVATLKFNNPSSFNSPKEVLIYMDGFIFMENYYEINQIGNRIEEQLATILRER